MDPQIQKFYEEHSSKIIAAASLAAFAILPYFKSKKPETQEKKKKRKDRLLVFGFLSYIIYKDVAQKGKNLKAYEECVKTDATAICASRFISQSVQF